MSNKKNKPLMPKLRFPAFRNSPEWISEKVDRLVDTITPPKKLPTSSYAVNGDFPIIDQSQNAICGWTDDREALIKDDLPLIIFGDHTCILKLLDRPFAQGADGIKILKPRPRIGTSYLYQYLSYRPVVTEEYKRHYSILKEKVVLFPDFKTGEQQKIADCLSSLDELITAQARKVDALKTHKKGLMQQLFPREGETQPRLRFPEFQNAEEWQRTSLGGVARLRNGYAFKSAEYVDDGPHQIITIANVQQGGLSIESTRRMAALPPDIQQHQVLSLGDILISMTGNVGRVCRVTVEGLLLNQRVGKLTPEKIDADFFYQLLQRDEFRNTMQLKAAGGAQGNLSSGDITDYVFSAPAETDEQLRIATCLSSLDALVTAATQELEALKIHKKGLMQQLFPSAEDVA